jgi:hypothetical protein
VVEKRYDFPEKSIGSRLDKYPKGRTTMNQWNQLQALLDSIFGHGRRQSSRLAKRIQGFDNETGEHIVIIEYRVKMATEQKNAKGFPSLSRYAGLLGRRI